MSVRLSLVKRNKSELLNIIPQFFVSTTALYLALSFMSYLQSLLSVPFANSDKKDDCV